MREKKNSKTPMKEIHFTVVLEDLRSQFKVFGEGLAGFRQETRERFDRVEKRLDLLADGLADVRG